jgi:hypothetical protein
MFKKRNWTKWQHVMFVEDFRVGIKTFELLRRVDQDSGITEWKRIYVKNCAHSLAKFLTVWWDGKQNGA